MKPTRPTVAEISLKAIAFNLSGVRSRVGRRVRIMAVVKANAYGHGAVEVSRFIERRFTDYFGVAFPEEGAELRNHGIKKPIHVFTLPSKSQADLCFESQLEPTICSLTEAKFLDQAGRSRKRSIPVHLKIDTGMNRIGVRVCDLDSLLNSIGKLSRIEIKGVFTHFATADEKDKSFTRKQLEEFGKALEIIHRHHVEPDLIHCANSGAVLDVPESFFSMVRPGIIIYGYYPSKNTSRSIPLSPALCMKTAVAMVKWVNAGESVSYGRRFIAPRRTKIVTLPIGYGDGYPRLLTNRSSALINGSRFPIVGSICMDQLMVDVGSADVSTGDQAVLIGSRGPLSITAWDLAEKLGTIPYEICCSVAARVPRVYTHS